MAHTWHLRLDAKLTAASLAPLSLSMRPSRSLDKWPSATCKWATRARSRRGCWFAEPSKHTKSYLSPVMEYLVSSWRSPSSGTVELDTANRKLLRAPPTVPPPSPASVRARRPEGGSCRTYPATSLPYPSDEPSHHLHDKNLGSADAPRPCACSPCSRRRGGGSG